MAREIMVRTKITFLVLAVAISQTFAAEEAAEEYRVKGAFLINFAKFVEWPPQVFKGGGEKISICVLGASPFTPDLDVAARLVVVENRPVSFRQITDAQQARQCQIVFVSVSERKRSHALLDAVQGESVLTVGEFKGFLSSGGVIELRVEDSKVRMEISAEAAKRAGLHISAKLMSLAQAGNR